MFSLEARLLIIDGHESHVNVEFLQYAENNNIIVLALPPHLTHHMQPLDVGIEVCSLASLRRPRDLASPPSSA